MIPFFQWQTISLGPVTIQVWGLMVALGLLLGTWVSSRFAWEKGLSKEVVTSGAFWVLLSAFVGARIFHILFYDLGLYLNDPVEILRIWHGGYSSMGGFLGAAVGYSLFMIKRKINWLTYANAFIFGLPAGIACGRLGCFFIHDHPGTMTNFFLGVKQPNGTVIHDLGLYLSINGLLLALLFFWLNKNERPQGFYVQVFLIWYGVTRFFLDFLRIADQTYWGLTPAQYLSLFMIIGGLLWVLKSYSSRSLETVSMS